MKTFFALNSDKKKIAILNPLNIQWNRVLNGVGSFSIQLKYSDYDSSFVYVYRDGGTDLGIISKISINYSISEGKTVQISGSFYESVLYNIPLVPFEYERSLDEYEGDLFYGYNAKPKEDLTNEKLNNYYIFSYKDGYKDDNFDKIVSSASTKACAKLAKIAIDNINLYKSKYNLNLELPDDVIEVSEGIVKESSGYYMYSVPKGTDLSLGDYIYNTLNGVFIDDNGELYPPRSPIMHTWFNPETSSVNIEFKTVSNTSYYLGDETGTVVEYSYNQDISSEPSAGIYRALYRKSADEYIEGESPYGSVEGIARRNNYAPNSVLPLDLSKYGKLIVKTDYLGNTFEDFITYYDCEMKVKEGLANFSNADNTLNIEITPVIKATDPDYTSMYELGDFVKFFGSYHRIVAINEVVKNNQQTLTITLSSLKRNMFRNYYNKTNTNFFETSIITR